MGCPHCPPTFDAAVTTALPQPLPTRRAIPRAVGVLATVALSAPAGTATLLFLGPPLALGAIAIVTVACWRLWRPDGADPRLSVQLAAPAATPARGAQTAVAASPSAGVPRAHAAQS